MNKLSLKACFGGLRLPRRGGFAACLLWISLVVFTGCFYAKPRLDPLAGWNYSSLNNLRANKAVYDDYQKYFQGLSEAEKDNFAYTEYYGDGTGQYAVKITIGLNGTNWRHVLIYNAENKRIKTIKYVSGHSRS